MGALNSVCMHVCACACVRVHLHVCGHACVRAYMHTVACVRACVRAACVRVCVCVRMQSCVCVLVYK